MAKKSVSANPLMVEWATDPDGIVHELRAAITAMGDRIGHDPEKCKLVVETLSLGINHLKARHKRDVDDRNADMKARAAKAKADAERAAAAAEIARTARIAELEAELASLK